MVVVPIYRYLDPPSREPKEFISGAIDFIRENVKPTDRIEIALSGGVDSSVTTKLFHLAGADVYPDHIDTGFMRRFKGREEPEAVAETFSEVPNFEVIDAKELFYKRIFGIRDAEKKRKEFREVYAEVFNRELKKHRCNVISQGTIYPDIVETEGGVKSQHNVQIEFEVERIVEPVAALYKHEIRAVAKELGLPESSYLRMPFPGPGLSVRVPGAITKERLEVEKDANDVVEQAIAEYMKKQYGVPMVYDKTGEQIPFQAFAATFEEGMKDVPNVIKAKAEKIVRDAGYDGRLSMELLDTKVTGMRDGKRVYDYPLCMQAEISDFEILTKIGNRIPEKTSVSRVLFKLVPGEGYPVAIRVIRSRDAMTAKVMDIDMHYLKQIGEKISKYAGEVFYDITDKPPATIEYE